MTLVISFLSLPSMQALAWTLVHFLWQGALLALAAAAVMHWPTASARSRYIAGVVTLALMMATPVGTFVLLQSAASAGTLSASSENLAEDAPAARADVVFDLASSPAPSSAASDRVLPAVVLLWLSGVLLLSARLVGGWAVARRLATTTRQPVSAEIQALAARVAERLGLRQFVRFAESPTVAVPIVIGWLKPVVLVPSAAVAGLPPAHLEALLAHELAHVRRHDYLINLLQSAIETLLFYHPAVWWVSGRVRQEREHCCDDAAVAVCDRFVYVNALTNLATMTAHTPLALAATDGSLLRRVRRLLASTPDERPSGGWLSMAVVVVVLAGLTPVMMAIGTGDQEADAARPAAPAAAAVPAPAPTPTTRPVATPTPGPRAVSPAPAAIAATPRPAAQPAVQAPTADAAERAASEARQQLEALRQRLEERERELSTLSQREREIEEQRALTELKLRSEAAREALETATQELQRAVRRHEIGIADEDAVTAARARVAAAERERRRIDADLGTIPLRRQIEAQRATTERERARLQQQVEAALARANGSAELARSQASLNARAVEELSAGLQQLDAARSRLAPDHPDVRRLEAQLRELERQVAGLFPIDDPSAQVRAGDVLVIDIAGEDQLPKRYTVEPGGTIRLPLIGPVQVAGGTAAQARVAIARALSERKLGQGRAVTVVIHRPR